MDQELVDGQCSKRLVAEDREQMRKILFTDNPFTEDSTSRQRIIFFKKEPTHARIKTERIGVLKPAMRLTSIFIIICLPKA